MTWRDKFESGSRNNWMYYTYVASILQLEKKSSRESELRYYQRLMSAPRPTFQQFVDYLLRTEVCFQVSYVLGFICWMTILSIYSKILLFPCERLQRPLATVLDPLSHLFDPVWHCWQVWNHQRWCSSYTRCEGCNHSRFSQKSWFQIWLILEVPTWHFHGPTGRTQVEIQASVISSW